MEIGRSFSTTKSDNANDSRSLFDITEYAYHTQYSSTATNAMDEHWLKRRIVDEFEAELVCTAWMKSRYVGFHAEIDGLSSTRSLDRGSSLLIRKGERRSSQHTLVGTY